METSNSGANNAVLHAQNNRWGLRPKETSISCANHAVLHAQKDRWGLRPMETRILVLITLFCMHKTTDEGWDP